MLPDYPQTKALLAEVFHERIKLAQQRRLGVFSQVKPTQLHEGTTCHLHRADGSFEEIEMQHLQASAHLEHDIKELEKMDVEKVTDLLDTLGERIASEQVQLMIKRIDEAVHEVGNVGDPDKPFKEQFFDLFQKQHVDFDEMGRPIWPQFVVGSKGMEDKIRDTLTEIQSDPQLRKRMESLIDQKRQEWRDREASRNLVE